MQALQNACSHVGAWNTQHIHMEIIWDFNFINDHWSHDHSKLCIPVQNIEMGVFTDKIPVCRVQYGGLLHPMIEVSGSLTHSVTKFIMWKVSNFQPCCIECQPTYLVIEQGTDGLEQANLFLNRVTTLLRNINKVKNSCSQVSQCSDSLHFNDIAILKGVIQNSWSVYHLPAKILVVCVTHIQRLGGECIRLHINICSCDLRKKKHSF